MLGCFCFVWFVAEDDGSLGYVQVLHQFSFVALNQQTALCVNLEINAFAMPWRWQHCVISAEGAWVGLKPDLQGGTLKKDKKGQNGPAQIKSDPPWRVLQLRLESWTGEAHFARLLFLDFEVQKKAPCVIFCCNFQPWGPRDLPRSLPWRVCSNVHRLARLEFEV